MLVSILHRITGGALDGRRPGVLVWWLLALADGAEAYADFAELAAHPVGLVVLVGLTWAFFQHLLSGHPPPRAGHRRRLSSSTTNKLLGDADVRRLAVR